MSGETDSSELSPPRHWHEDGLGEAATGCFFLVGGSLALAQAAGIWPLEWALPSWAAAGLVGYLLTN